MADTAQCAKVMICFGIEFNSLYFTIEKSCNFSHCHICFSHLTFTVSPYFSFYILSNKNIQNIQFSLKLKN